MNDSIEALTDSDYTGISKLNHNQLRLVDKMASTKFILVMYAVTLTSIGLYIGIITPPIYSEVVQWTVSAYILGNAFIQSKWGK